MNIGMVMIACKEKTARWIAYHLPRRVCYWVAIRVGTEATRGAHRHQEVPTVTIVEMLERWQWRL
jgi:hypothetical protein